MTHHPHKYGFHWNVSADDPHPHKSGFHCVISCSRQCYGCIHYEDKLISTHGLLILILSVQLQNEPATIYTQRTRIR